MTRKPLALLAAAGLIVVLPAPNATAARPRWTGVHFDKVSSDEVTGTITLRGWFVQSQINKRAARDRRAVQGACRPGQKIVFKSDAFAATDQLATTTIDGNDFFTLQFEPRNVQAPHVELRACGSTKFGSDPVRGGIGEWFDADVRSAIALAHTGSNERATAGVAVALLAGGILLLVLTRKRRHSNAPPRDRRSEQVRAPSS